MPCQYWTPAGNRRKTLVTTNNRDAPATILHIIVWLTPKAWHNFVALMFDKPYPSPIWIALRSHVTPELQAVTFPPCAYQSTSKGKQTFTPTTRMPTSSMHELHSTGQCIHDHQTIMGANVTTAGIYLLEMRGNVLDRVTGDVHNPQYDVDLVFAETIRLTRVQCPERDPYFQNRDTVWPYIKVAHTEEA